MAKDSGPVAKAFKKLFKFRDSADETAKAVTIASPIKGTVVPIAEVKDDTFSSQMLGPSAALIPAEGRVFAPFDGEIMQFETGHAVGITSPLGFETLIHIGINTVELKGAGFKTYFATGDLVKKGDLLIEFDGAAIKEKGYDIVTPVIVNELGSYSRVTVDASGTIEAGAPLLTLYP